MASERLPFFTDPNDYHDARHHLRSAYWTSEQRLAAAVLATAVDDLTRWTTNGQTLESMRELPRLQVWIWSREATTPFGSLGAVCVLLGLDLGYVRRRLAEAQGTAEIARGAMDPGVGTPEVLRAAAGL